jgi:hypothetical protein
MNIDTTQIKTAEERLADGLHYYAQGGSDPLVARQVIGEYKWVQTYAGLGQIEATEFLSAHLGFPITVTAGSPVPDGSPCWMLSAKGVDGLVYVNIESTRDMIVSIIPMIKHEFRVLRGESMRLEA